MNEFKKKRKICVLALLVAIFVALFLSSRAFSSEENKTVVARSGVIRLKRGSLNSNGNDNTNKNINSNDNSEILKPVQDDSGDNNNNLNDNTNDQTPPPPAPPLDQGEENNNVNDNGNDNSNDECQMSNNIDNVNSNDNENSSNSDTNINSNDNIGDNVNSNSSDLPTPEANENVNNDQSDLNNNVNSNGNVEVVPDFSISCPERVQAGQEFGVSISITGDNIDGLRYLWNEDGEVGEEFGYEGITTTLKYIKPGNYTIVGRVEGENGIYKEKECQVDVSNPELSGQVKIIAVLPNPVGADNALKPQGEAVWLYNESDNYIDLSGWVLYDTDDTHELYLTTLNVAGEGEEMMIPPRKRIMVYRNGDSDFSLNNEGDTVRLYSGPIEMTGQLQDETTYPASQEGKVYERDLESGGWSVPPVPFGTGQESSPSLSLTPSPVPFGTGQVGTGRIPASYGTGQESQKSIFKFLSDSFLAYASEISEVVSEGFQDFTFSKEEWLAGDLDKQDFSLENKSGNKKSVYLGISDVSPLVEGNIPVEMGNWLIKIKNEGRCLLGYEGDFSLSDLVNHEKPFLQLDPGEKEDLELELVLKQDSIFRMDDKTVEFAFVLEEDDNIESENNIGANEGVEEQETINSNNNSGINELESKIGENIGINSNENKGENLLVGTSQPISGEINLVKPDNLAKVKTKPVGKKKKDEKKRKKSKKSINFSAETGSWVKPRMTPTPLGQVGLPGAMQTPLPPAPPLAQGEEDFESNSSNVSNSEQDQPKTMIASAKNQTTPWSWWYSFIGGNYLLKLFGLWMVVWCGVFWVMKRRKG